MNCAVKPLADSDFSSHDKRWMRLAGLYAGRAQGHSWPNPAVGCVLVSADNRLIAVGSTQAGGRPHAEAEALLKAEKPVQLMSLLSLVHIKGADLPVRTFWFRRGWAVLSML